MIELILVYLAMLLTFTTVKLCKLENTVSRIKNIMTNWAEQSLDREEARDEERHVREREEHPEYDENGTRLPYEK